MVACPLPLYLAKQKLTLLWLQLKCPQDEMVPRAQQLIIVQSVTVERVWSMLHVDKDDRQLCHERQK